MLHRFTYIPGCAGSTFKVDGSTVIKASVGVDSHSADGCSPLYMAALKGHVDAVKELLCEKADPLLTWST